jgi:hypothetical protein
MRKQAYFSTPARWSCWSTLLRNRAKTVPAKHDRSISRRCRPKPAVRNESAALSQSLRLDVARGIQHLPQHLSTPMTASLITVREPSRELHLRINGGTVQPGEFAYRGLVTFLVLVTPHPALLVVPVRTWRVGKTERWPASRPKHLPLRADLEPAGVFTAVTAGLRRGCGARDA